MFLLKKIIRSNDLLSLKDYKRMQSIASIETYAYGMNKHLVCKKEEIECNNRRRRHKRT